MNDPSGPHLASERLQALAEGELGGADGTAARAHVDGCARCRSEFEAWTLLFRELEELPALGPSGAFAERVMAHVGGVAPVRASWFDRVRALLPARRSAPADRHLSEVGIQNYLEGLLDRPVMARVEVHVTSCTRCQDEVRAWRPLFSALEALPRVAPPAGFAERVMSQVPVGAIAEAYRDPEPAPGLRIARAARRFLPATPKGWTIAGGLATAPAVGLVAAMATVFFHPLLSFRDVGVYASWKATQFTAGLWGWTLGYLTESPLVYRAMELLVALGQSPGVAVAGFLALWGVTLASVAIVYRYIIVPSRTSGPHVQAS